MHGARRAVILPVVLVILLVLGVLASGFAFRAHGDLASTQAMAYRLQTRMAAEAGLEKVKLMMRAARLDMATWYDNPDELHRIIVWAHEGDETIWGSNDEFTDDKTVYRFSIVADDPTDDEDFIRFGLTDEASKINLNTATERQLMILMRAAVGEDEEIDPRLIVDAILDWRDTDDQPRGEEEDTEGEYYESLDHRPYRVKNGPFDTVEELLLVKGMTPEILYGEDYDRNGLLTPNEDDGDKTFPLDNQDNSLNRGLFPYLTIFSYESNVANNNRPRAYLFADEAALRGELAYIFEEDPEVVDYIVSATRSQQGTGGGAEAGDGSGESGSGGPGSLGGGRGGRGPAPADRGGEAGDADPGFDEKSGDSRKAGARSQRQPDEKDGDKPDDGVGEPGDDGDMPSGETGDGLGGDESGGDPEGETGEGEEKAEGEEGDGDGGTSSSQLTSPAALFRDADGGNPLRVDEHLAILMDRTTTHPPEEQELVGLININTASYLVLRGIEGLSDEQVAAIIEARPEVELEQKATTAWLVTEEVLDLETYIEIAPRITARGQQFTIEALGYADHIGMVSRLQVVVDMIGPIAQTIYYRDLTSLGGHYPIREEDGDKIRVR